jgi:predicted RNA binding protein YcfA (HicA-like mRNA interferase family)
MGSMTISRSDKICRALEKNGWTLDELYRGIRTYQAYHHKDFQHFIFVSRNGHVRRGPTFKESVLVPSNVVDSWL